MGNYNGNGQSNRAPRGRLAGDSQSGGVSVDGGSSGANSIGLSASHVGAGTSSALAGSGIGSAAMPGGGSQVVPTPRWMGKRVGRFRLVALLGQGAMGRVFRAEDTLMGRHVALKLLPRTIKGKGGVSVGAELLIREAKAAAAIEHPNAVAIYEVNQSGDVCYVAMELLEGGSLRDLVRAAGPMDLTRACLLCAEAAEALAAAHAVGVVHRDIKPANLMLSRNGRCKVVDFGLARLDEAGRGGEWANGSAAESVGTPQFIAPDILAGAPASASSDIYSLGGTLFYLLTGRPPFEAKTTRELLKMHVSAPVPDLRRMRPDASRGLADAVAKALAKRPPERWASMEQFARVMRVHAIPISSAAESSGVIAPPPTPSYVPPGSAPAPSPAVPARPARPASPLQEPLPEAELAQAIAPPSPAAASAGAFRGVAAAGGRMLRLYNGLPLWSRLAGSGALTLLVAVALCVAFVKSPPRDVSANTDEPAPPAPAQRAPAQTPAAAPARPVQSPIVAAAWPVPAPPRVAAPPVPRPPAILPHVPGELLRYGDFEGHKDIGDFKQPGAVDFDPVHHDYTITGDGFDVYGKSDSFHFAWRKMSGDLTIKADIHFVHTSPAIFRKAVLIVRQSLEPNSPFTDIVLHGEKTVVVQDRMKAGEQAVQQMTNLRGSTLWFVRRGDQFIGYISSPTGVPQPVAEVTVPMKDPVYVGLGVSARDNRQRKEVKPETAVFSGVEIDPVARVTTLPPAPSR